MLCKRRKQNYNKSWKKRGVTKLNWSRLANASTMSNKRKPKRPPKKAWLDRC